MRIKKSKMLSHIDQYLGAEIFPDFPHFPAPCDGVRGRPRHLVTAAVTFGPLHPVDRQHAANIGYAIAALLEHITGKKRHRLTAAEPLLASMGYANVVH
jgi:hypothetical protein